MLTPLESIPGAKIVKYLGPINLYFVKEAWGVRNEGKFVYKTVRKLFWSMTRVISSRSPVAVLSCSYGGGTDFRESPSCRSWWECINMLQVMSRLNF